MTYWLEGQAPHGKRLWEKLKHVRVSGNNIIDVPPGHVYLQGGKMHN